MPSISWFLLSCATAVFAQSFDPGDTKSPTQFDASKVGTNTSTNTTYSNPIMTANAGDP